jgi:uncharacterized lipoprotein YehR (DUF1307 family)
MKQNGGIKMKKLLALVMALTFTFSLAGCGGNSTSTPEAAPVQNVKAEFTAEQQEFAQEYIDLVEAYNLIVDRVNEAPELLENEELINVMNELADEITNIDELFEDPETLTSEAMASLRVAFEEVYKFIAEAESLLEQVEGSN